MPTPLSAKNKGEGGHVRGGRAGETLGAEAEWGWVLWGDKLVTFPQENK